MLDTNKINKQISALEAENEEKNRENEQNAATLTAKESEPKTVVYDTDNAAKVTLPEKPEIELPTYERMEYTPKTDEQISQDVEENLKEYKENALKSFDSAYETTKAQKEREKVVESEKKAEEDKALENAYADAEKAIINDLIRRGMTNSSTSELLKAKNASDRDNALKKASDDYAKAIADIDYDIAKAEAKRQQAINDFNITYALKYADRVNKLKAEREEAVEKALKYNNGISEQEFKDKVEKEKTESKLYGEALEHAQTEKIIENKEQYEVENSYEYRIYTILRNQLAGMSKEEAYNALRNDPTYADNLTTSYYLQLVDEFGRGQLIPYDREYGVNVDEK